MMDELFKGAENMLVIIVLACIIVFMAMCVDLISGLHKAKQRKEIRSSYGLKRSLGKFIMYEGGMLIACGVDVLMHFCKLLKVVHMDVIYGIPVVTCLLGIFLLIVEFISVREKADDKTKTEISRVEQLAAKMVNKDELVGALTQAIINAGKSSNNDKTD
jgi:hypothetical protein